VWQVHVVQDLVSKSQLPPWTKDISSGFWRLLTVRSVRSGDSTPPPHSA
jgi:hypothetical protein